MKKIYVVAGAVLLVVLLLFAWLFVIDFSIFADTLSEGAENITSDDESRFIGIWETPYIPGDERFVGFNGIYKFNSDGTGTIGTRLCDWDVIDNQLIIDYNVGLSILTYNFSFSNEENTLALTNEFGTLEFTKHQV